MNFFLTLEVCCDDEADCARHGRSAADSAVGVVYTRFQDLGSEMLRELSPRSVRAPLFADRFDCIDVGRHLASAQFPGKFCVVADTLPDANMVERELRRQFPKLDLCLVSGDEAGVMDPPYRAHA